MRVVNGSEKNEVSWACDKTIASASVKRSSIFKLLNLNVGRGFQQTYQESQRKCLGFYWFHCAVDRILAVKSRLKMSFLKHFQLLLEEYYHFFLEIQRFNWLSTSADKEFCSKFVFVPHFLPKIGYKNYLLFWKFYTDFGRTHSSFQYLPYTVVILIRRLFTTPKKNWAAQVRK